MNASLPSASSLGEVSVTAENVGMKSLIFSIGK